MKKDKVLSSQIDLTVLASLQQAGPMHGYALIAHLKAASDGLFDFAEGTVYPILHGLEQQGFIAGEWAAADGGRKRRVYHLTPAGQHELAGKAARWSRFAHAVEAMLKPPAKGSRT